MGGVMSVAVARPGRRARAVQEKQYRQQVYEYSHTLILSVLAGRFNHVVLLSF